MSFIISHLNSIETTIKKEAHANENLGDFRYNHHLRKGFLLAYSNLRPSEQDMVRETIDDLTIYGKNIKFIPPLERQDLDHTKYEYNYYLRRKKSKKELKKLRIKALHFLAGFGVIEFEIRKGLLAKEESLQIIRLDSTKNHAIFDLLNDFEVENLDLAVTGIKKLLTGNKIEYNIEKEQGAVVDQFGNKIKDIEFREDSNPNKFFNYMWKNKGKEVSYLEIRTALGLRPNQKTTVSQWIDQLELGEFFDLPKSRTAVLRTTGKK